MTQAWRIPVRTSLKDKPWISAFDNRSNFATHIESQSYAFPWGKQHPEWLTVHSDVMIPGYLTGLNNVTWNQEYSDQVYMQMAQNTLDEIAWTIQTYYLGGILTTTETPTTSDTTSKTSDTIDTSTIIATVDPSTRPTTPTITSITGSPIVLLAGLICIYGIKRKRRRK